MEKLHRTCLHCQEGQRRQCQAERSVGTRRVRVYVTGSRGLEIGALGEGDGNGPKLDTGDGCITAIVQKNPSIVQFKFVAHFLLCSGQAV